MIDELLKQYDLKFDDLNAMERETLISWSQSLESNALTVAKIQMFVYGIRDAIEQQLIEEPEFNYIWIFKVENRKQILLKARLRNIMLLEAFLSGPEKAQKAISQSIAGFASNRKGR